MISPSRSVFVVAIELARRLLAYSLPMCHVQDRRQKFKNARSAAVGCGLLPKIETEDVQTGCFETLQHPQEQASELAARKKSRKI